MFKVEIFNEYSNNWITLSMHINQKYAEIVFNVMKKREKAIRLIYDGKIIKEERNGIEKAT